MFSDPDRLPASTMTTASAAAARRRLRWANRYNTRRRHSAIGNITPNAYETATFAILTEAA